MESSNQPDRDHRDDRDPPPPFLGSWRNVYIALLTQLAVLVALFYLIGRWAS